MANLTLYGTLLAWLIMQLRVSWFSRRPAPSMQTNTQVRSLHSMIASMDCNCCITTNNAYRQLCLSAFTRRTLLPKLNMMIWWWQSWQFAPAVVTTLSQWQCLCLVQLLQTSMHSAFHAMASWSLLSIVLKVRDKFLGAYCFVQSWLTVSCLSLFSVMYRAWTIYVVAAGYSHRRTLGFKEGFSAEDNEEIEGGSKTYVFRLQL